MQSNLHLAPATIDAYGRNLNAYLAFCSKHNLLRETVTREALALYVQDLASRPSPRGAKIVSICSGYGLSRATMQQRLTTIRLYHDYLIGKQIRPDNPVGYYDLGHGWCSYEFFDQCLHRMACARCDFYIPKTSDRGILLQARDGLLKMLQEIPLNDEERAAVDGDVQALD